MASRSSTWDFTIMAIFGSRSRSGREYNWSSIAVRYGELSCLPVFSNLSTTTAKAALAILSRSRIDINRGNVTDRHPTPLCDVRRHLRCRSHHTPYQWPSHFLSPSHLIISCHVVSFVLTDG